MTEQQPEATPRRASRAPLAAALVGVAGVALVAGFVLAGLAGSAPASGAGAPEAPSVAPIDAPAFLDVGWVAPGAQAPIAEEFRGNGNGLGRAIRDGRISITKIDGAKLSLVTVDGWTRTIDATGATITRGGEAITVADLAVGDEITMRQERQADGTFEVTAIRVVLPKVGGTVTAVTASSITLAARDGTTVTVKVTASTAYRLGRQDADKSVVKVGMRAVATGSKDAGGTLTATSVAVQPARVVGTVTAISSTSITIETRKDATVAIEVTASTTFRVAGVESATVKDVKVGMWLVAEGIRVDDGTLTASAVGAAAVGERPGRNGKGWGDWKPWRGGPKASPSPAGTTPPSSNG